MKNLLITILLTTFAFTSHAQLKGKISRLEGSWRYEGGSGYEVWKWNGDELIGSGYRSTKFQDTLLVEELKITLVNKRLLYSSKTRQQTPAGTVVNEHRFMSRDSKKLRFDNIDNDNPRSVHYKFGVFNKNKLQILISFDGKPKPVVLKLQRHQSDMVLN
jgi:hypothetical protein